VTFTHLYAIISQKNHQQELCEQTWNIRKNLNVENNALRSFLHGFMCLRVYDVAILCMWWGTTEHGSTVHFMYGAVDSTTGWAESEACNGTRSSHWPYNYKSHRIQATELLMTCLELSADSILCCIVITYSSAEWNRMLWANYQLLSDQLTFLWQVRTLQQLQYESAEVQLVTLCSSVMKLHKY